MSRRERIVEAWCWRSAATARSSGSRRTSTSTCAWLPPASDTKSLPIPSQCIRIRPTGRSQNREEVWSSGVQAIRLLSEELPRQYRPALADAAARAGSVLFQLGARNEARAAFELAMRLGPLSFSHRRRLYRALATAFGPKPRSPSACATGVCSPSRSSSGRQLWVCETRAVKGSRRAADRLIIWGASGHALVVTDIIRLVGQHEIVGFLDDLYAGPGLTRRVSPVLGGRECLDELRGAGVSQAIIAVGDCATRLSLAELACAKGFSLIRAIHPRAIIATEASVGPGTVVCAGVVVNPWVSIGANAIVNTSASVDHECLLEDGVHIGPGARPWRSRSCGARGLGGYRRHPEGWSADRDGFDCRSGSGRTQRRPSGRGCLRRTRARQKAAIPRWRLRCGLPI